jgi:hypothetical protein
MRSQFYFPIERAKAGEFSASGALAPRTKGVMCPIFDLPRAETFREFALLQSTVASTLARTWGTAHELYLDLFRYDPDLLTPAGDPYVALLFNSARQVRLKAIPVIGPLLERRGTSGAYIRGVAGIAERDGRGAAIRIPFADLSQAERLNAVIDEIQGAIGVKDSDCDVFLDAGPADSLPGGLPAAATLLRQTLLHAAQTVSRRQFRTLILCGSSIPRSPRKRADGAPIRIANLEFQAWSEVLNSKEYRHVRFGDYGARYANQSDKKQKARAPARIQLATPEHHVLYIGASESYRALARKAADSPEFGAQHGVWGKHAVRDSANGRGGVGTPTDWVARDAHMHIESMVRAVESRLGEVSPSIAVDTTGKAEPHGQIDLLISQN